MYNYLFITFKKKNVHAGKQFICCLKVYFGSQQFMEHGHTNFCTCNWILFTTTFYINELNGKYTKICKRD